MRTSAKKPSPSRHESGDPLSPEPGPGLLRWGARPASSYLPNLTPKGSAVLSLAPSARVISTAGSLSLASFIALAGVTQAASMPAFSYTVSGDTLKASVTGDARTGVWRVRFVKPSGDRRVDIVLRTGDIDWSGTVRISQRFGNSWSLVSSRSIDGALAGGAPVSACNAGVCWDTSLFRLPRDGDARFAVTVRLSRDGTYLVSGGVRQASEAFQFGSWLTSASKPVTH
jgi:hypothetical protein